MPDITKQSLAEKAAELKREYYEVKWRYLETEFSRASRYKTGLPQDATPSMLAKAAAEEEAKKQVRSSRFNGYRQLLNNLISNTLGVKFGLWRTDAGRLLEYTAELKRQEEQLNYLLVLGRAGVFPVEEEMRATLIKQYSAIVASLKESLIGAEKAAELKREYYDVKWRYWETEFSRASSLKTGLPHDATPSMRFTAAAEEEDEKQTRSRRFQERRLLLNKLISYSLDIGFGLWRTDAGRLLEYTAELKRQEEQLYYLRILGPSGLFPNEEEMRETLIKRYSAAIVILKESLTGAALYAPVQ
jgi:ERCC4-type nuclease